MTTDDRERLAHELTADEGVRLKPYTDIVGKLTIGIGRNLTDKGITAVEALSLFQHDVDECVADLNLFGWFVHLDPVRQTALCNLRFNLGPHKLRGFVKFLAALSVGDYERASAEILNSHWATQVQPSRRDRIARQIRTGEP